MRLNRLMKPNDGYANKRRLSFLTYFCQKKFYNLKSAFRPNYEQVICLCNLSVFAFICQYRQNDVSQKMSKLIFSSLTLLMTSKTLTFYELPFFRCSETDHKFPSCMAMLLPLEMIFLFKRIFEASKTTRNWYFQLCIVENALVWFQLCEFLEKFLTN